MLKSLAVLVSLLLIKMIIGESVTFAPEEKECMQELNLEEQHILDHFDETDWTLDENIPHVDEFADCLLKKLNVDIDSEISDYTALEQFLEVVFHINDLNIQDKMQFAKDVVSNCKIVHTTEKHSIKFINCMGKTIMGKF